jgi:hypothetical protein
LGYRRIHRAVTFFHGATYDGDPDGGRLSSLFDSHLSKMTSATTLWSNAAELQKYDLMIASCECEEVTATATEYQSMTDYLRLGGRLFGTDLQYIWYKNSTDPNLSGSAQIVSGNLTPGASPIALETGFPKGRALGDWLSFVSPANTPDEVSCDQVWDNFSGVNQPAWQIWGTSERIDGGDRHPRMLSVNTPVGVPVDQQCGRAVMYPEACGADLLSGEQALVFLLFDVAACIQDDTKPIMPPVIVP